jgi:hypothetical protein
MTARAPGKLSADLFALGPHALVGHDNAAFGHDQLDAAQAEAEEVKSHTARLMTSAGKRGRC